ncbi:MAG: hypothetical protein Q7W30_00660 [Coriobacteriia bacterium]|nr:hypothetical protein [Coriobacteriia bacterium]
MATWGLDHLAGRGFEIEIVDLSRVLQPALAGRDIPLGPWRVTHIRDMGEVDRLIRDRATGTVYVDFLLGISDVGPREAPVFGALHRHAAPYILVYAGAVPPPDPSAPGVAAQRGSRFADPTRVLRALAGRVTRLARRAGVAYALPARVYAGHAQAIERFIDRYPALRGRVRPINSFDFDRFLALQAATPTIERDGTCLFLDEGLLGHPDFEYLGITRLDGAAYAASMSRLFDAVEAATGLTVRIAAHPRVDPVALGEAAGGREVIVGHTPELVLRSDAVIAHASTAINFAALAARPLIVCETAGMRATGYSGQVHGAARALGLRVLDAEDPTAIAALPRDPTEWPSPAYEAYLGRYVRSPDAPAANTWDIVATDLAAGI